MHDSFLNLFEKTFHWIKESNYGSPWLCKNRFFKKWKVIFCWNRNWWQYDSFSETEFTGDFSLSSIEYPQDETISKYEGSVKNGVPWGKGTLTYRNGDIYLGEFENGEKNGFGLKIFAEDDEDEAQQNLENLLKMIKDKEMEP